MLSRKTLPGTRACLLMVSTVVGAPSLAAQVNVTVELPRLPVAEYHRPYVAMWIENAADQRFAGNLALWYDVRKRDNGGAKWLKDMRQWWRTSGRDLKTPVDGITGATRAPGNQDVQLGTASAITALAPGEYQLVVEAARENGGREVVRVPFRWPASAVQSAHAKGDGELGAVALEIKP